MPESGIMSVHPLTNVLTIAGSDPGGGAGIQADLKVFDHLGLYGLSAVTALTAQNTLGVQAMYPVPPVQLKAQLSSIIADFTVTAAKTGMMPEVEAIEEVSRLAAAGVLGKLVVDPVLVSTSGTMLSKKESVRRLISVLLPQCTLVTPNIDEAVTLTGIGITGESGAMDAARALVAAGAGAACVTGGHWPGAPVDYLFDGSTMRSLPGTRIGGGAQTHGTGCLFSAAATSYLAMGNDVHESVVMAKRLVEDAVSAAVSPGRGMQVPRLPHPG
ncbi:MAG: bifunctional hydroxymethylpyrimidine kinase/phosphomethylpyrimidine kinase [Actinobacteria bacterium]|nr:bifunctional hydroxymethylpyrimidine kinase/phosphomethylpyrimidine kinase [Actinomycetota bacterium]